MNWLSLPAGDVHAQKGHRYRATVSLEKGITKQQVQTYLQGHGWGDVQLYDAAAADTFPGDWGDAGVATSDTSRRILRGEATRLEGDTTIAESPSFPASLFVSYDLLHGYELGAQLTAPAPSSGGSSGKVWAFFGGLLLLGGAGAAGYWYTVKGRRTRRR